MEFLDVVGSRRSIRWFKTWERGPAGTRSRRFSKLPALYHLPGQPCSRGGAIVVERDALDEQTRPRGYSAPTTGRAPQHAGPGCGSTGTPTPSVTSPESFQEQTVMLTRRPGALPAGVRLEQGK